MNNSRKVNLFHYSILLCFLAVFCIASTCQSPSRLSYHFKQYPNSHFDLLHALNHLPEVSRYHDDIELLRHYQQAGVQQSNLLIAKYYANNHYLTLAHKAFQSAIKHQDEGALKGYAHFLIKHELWHELLMLADENPAASNQQWQVIAKMQAKQPLNESLEQGFADFPLAAGCRSQLGVIATSYKTSQHANTLIDALSPILTPLGICFTTPQYLSKRSVQCASNAVGNIDCQFNLAHRDLIESELSALVVFAEQGGANTTKGIAKVALEHDENVLLHEIMHLYGFVDEYRLTAQHAEQTCQLAARHHTPNVRFMASQSGVEQKALLNWHPAKTCENSDVIAYKRSPTTSIMELQALGLSAQYRTLLAQSVDYLPQQPHFAYYFYLQSQDQQWLNMALKMGNFAAKSLYADNLITQQKYQEALRILVSLGDWPMAYSQQARIYLKQRAFTKAKQSIIKAQQQGDSFAEVYLAQWTCETSLCSYEKKRRLLKRAAKTNNPLAIFRLSQLEQTLGAKIGTNG